MNLRHVFGVVGVAALLMHCSPPADSERALPEPATLEGSLTLNAERQQRLEIETQPLAALDYATRIEGFGQVIDSAPLFQLAAETEAAASRLQLAQSVLERTRTLAQDQGNASQESLEQAESEVELERAQQALLQRRWIAEWGPELAALGSAERSRRLERLSRGQEALVRLELPDEAHVTPAHPAQLHALLGGTRTWEVQRVWRAPMATTRLPGRSWLALVADADSLQIGQELTVRVARDEPPQHGVMVPAAAVVTYASRGWCFVQLDGERFERREIALDRPVDDGYFVTHSLTPGTRVVTRGAALLLAAESGTETETEAD